MIQKYVFGKPIETGAVVQKIPEAKSEISILQLEKMGTQAEDKVVLFYAMEETDIVYGLGEQVRGINKRGFSYISYATDDPIHTEGKHSLYGAHNFFMVSGSKNFGVFVDDPGKVVFDIGETLIEMLTITAGKDCVIYIIEGDSLKEIAKQFRQLVGRSYIAPKWAFGYQQSRWGYESEKDVKEVISGYQKNGIPLEAVYLDIDYMEDYKDFTVDQKKFPNFSEFVEELKEQHIHLIPIIDAGVKVEDGYSVYEEGTANHYFCKDGEGKDFTAAVWPGKVHFPDVLNTKAREWFGGKYRYLIEQGIDGFWNDMNEPAIFYSEENLKKVMEEIVSMKDENLDIQSFFYLKGLVHSLSNSSKDYAAFYHNMDGIKLCHDRVHNLYGFYMTRAAAEAFEKISPEKRILLFSRSSYIGMHRYGGIWTGDNHAWWQQLLCSIQQMPSLNMCGILYTGSDIGGFGGDTTRDLLLRWLEFGIFTPLMRNHSAAGTRMQEAYQFGDTSDFRNIIRIRYALIPYLYSEFMKAALEDEMYFRPLAFDYPEDVHAGRVEDQLMVGEGIMIAPVYTQNAVGRYVYLPEEMLMVRMTAPEEKKFEVLKQGHHYISAALNEVVFFVKKNHVVLLAVLGDAVNTTADLEQAKYEWIGYVPEQAEYMLYQDDGVSKDYVLQEKWKVCRFCKEDFSDGYQIAEE